jgi:hypothetical protein
MGQLLYTEDGQQEIPVLADEGYLSRTGYAALNEVAKISAVMN